MSKSRFPLISCVRTCVALLKIEDLFILNSSKNSSTFAVLYFVPLSKKTELAHYRKSNCFVDEENLIAYLFFSIGYSFNSADGEYRSRVSDFKLFTKFTKTDLFKRVSRRASRYFHFRRWKTKHVLLKNMLSLDWQKVNQRIRRSILSNSLERSMFSIHYLLLMHFLSDHWTEMGINKPYRLLFFNKKLKKTSTELTALRSMNAAITKDFKEASKLPTFFKWVHRFAYDRSLLGVKTVPLTATAVASPYNVLQKDWLEMFLIWMSNDLRASGIIPSSSTMHGFCCNIGHFREIFDSRDIQFKIDKAKIAQKIIKYLTESRSYTKKLVSNTGNSMNKQVQKHMLARMNKIKRNIDSIVKYLKDKMLLSNVCVSVFMQNAGITLISSIHKASTTPVYNRKINYHYEKKGSDRFIAMIFELLYTLYVYNTRIGFIHGDLHLGNVCVKVSKGSGTESFLVNSIKFVFPKPAVKTTIIDFSRSVLKPKARLSDFYLMHRKFRVVGGKKDPIPVKKVPKIKSKTDLDKYFNVHLSASDKKVLSVFGGLSRNSQIKATHSQLVSMFFGIFPNFSTDRGLIMYFSMLNLDSFFKLCVYLDVYCLVKKVIKIHKVIKTMVLDTSAFYLCCSIEQYIRSIMYYFMIYLRENRFRKMIEIIDRMAQPNLDIIKIFFPEWAESEYEHVSNLSIFELKLPKGDPWSKLIGASKRKILKQMDKKKYECSGKIYDAGAKVTRRNSFAKGQHTVFRKEQESIK